MKTLLSILLLAAASVAADDVTIEIIDSRDDALRVSVTDVHSPRPATAEVYREDGPTQAPIRTASFNTPVAGAWVDGLEPWSDYTIIVTVGEGASQERHPARGWTTRQDIAYDLFMQTTASSACEEIQSKHLRQLSAYPLMGLSLLQAGGQAGMTWGEANIFMHRQLKAHADMMAERRRQAQDNSW